MLTRKFLVAIALVFVSACNTLEVGIETKSGVPSMTQSSTPTTPAPLSTRSAASSVSPLPSPPVASPTPASNLDCKSEGDSISCLDEALKVRFTYPSTWGMITRQGGPGNCGGYAYTYRFDHSPITSAEGTSLDFCHTSGALENRMFNGFKHQDNTGTTQQISVCDSYAGQATDCQPVQPNVYLLSFFPNINLDLICDPPGLDGNLVFLQEVAIDLPLESQIQGLLFSAEILSPQAKQTLFAPLGGFPVGPECQDPANQAKFKQALQDLMQAIHTGQVDAETSRNLAGVEMLAKSFQVVQP